MTMIYQDFYTGKYTLRRMPLTVHLTHVQEATAGSVKCISRLDENCGHTLPSTGLQSQQNVANNLAMYCLLQTWQCTEQTSTATIYITADTQQQR